MADFDDRPISVYDNLNVVNVATTMLLHSSTPKAKSTTNALRSSHEEKLHKQPAQPHLLPNGQSHQQQAQQQQQQVPSPLNQQRLPSNNALYATPLKAATAKAATTTATITTTASMPMTTTTATTTTGMPSSYSTATDFTGQRPLSQHSQSELNETSQNIAAVKAALNDAKSKFFGLNGYSNDTTDRPHSSQGLLSNYNNISIDSEPQKVKVHIVSPLPSPTKPQPKYQNIPENSAIYRQQQQQQQQQPQSQHQQLFAAPSVSIPSPTSASPSTPGMSTIPLTPLITSSAASPQHDPPNFDSGHSGRWQQHQLSTPTNYKQLPLNDIDDPQPSQAVYMTTTVPQNMKGSKIAGRHTPTRNSLRHSRMLVVNNKNYQASGHPNPLNFKYPNLAHGLLILQTILGALLMFLAVWIFFLAPNASVADNPYWSGLALFFTGVIGLVLIRYRRIKRHKVRENCFVFLRADSYLLSLAALLLCVVALLCAAIHFGRLMDSNTRCVSSNILMENASCSCTFNAPQPVNATANDSQEWPDGAAENMELDNPVYSVEYRDLSCQEVKGEWSFILGTSITLNSLGFIVSLVYIVLLACCRKTSKRFYSSVHTSTF